MRKQFIALSWLKTLPFVNFVRKQMEEEKDRLLAAYFSGKFQALEGEVAKVQNLKTLSTILKRFGILITKEAYGNLQQKTT